MGTFNYMRYGATYTYKCPPSFEFYETHNTTLANRTSTCQWPTVWDTPALPECISKQKKFKKILCMQLETSDSMGLILI